MSPRLLVLLVLAVLLPRPVHAELPRANWQLLSHTVPPVVAPGDHGSSEGEEAHQ